MESCTTTIAPEMQTDKNAGMKRKGRKLLHFRGSTEQFDTKMRRTFFIDAFFIQVDRIIRKPVALVNITP